MKVNIVRMMYFSDGMHSRSTLTAFCMAQQLQDSKPQESTEFHSAVTFSVFPVSIKQRVTRGAKKRLQSRIIQLENEAVCPEGHLRLSDIITSAIINANFTHLRWKREEG